MSEDCKEIITDRSGRSPSQKTLIYYQLTDNNINEIYRRLAPSFGINIKVLAEEGEEYTHQSGDDNNPTRIDKGIVPKGNSYMMVSRQPNTNMDGFIEAVRAEQKAQQPPINPPKT